MKNKDQILLEQAYSTIVKEFLGFGKKSQDENNFGVKFVNLLAKGLTAKQFKHKRINGGDQLVKDNGHGMTMTVSMGGDKDRFKETPVSVLIKYSEQELYKNWNFTSLQATYPYRKDLSGASMDDQKKAHAENTQWEEGQRKKVGQIYDIVAAFDDADQSKIQALMD